MTKVLIMLLVSATLFPQTPSAHKISNYMQETGLMYYEDVTDRNRCERESGDRSACESYDRILQHLDDEFEINIKSAPNTSYVLLLGWAAILTREANRDSSPSAYAKGQECLSAAYEIAKLGVFDPAGCTAKAIQAAKDKDDDKARHDYWTACIKNHWDCEKSVPPQEAAKIKFDLLPAGAKAVLQNNSEAVKASPAAAAALAQDGHIFTPQELADAVANGRASKCAIVTNPVGADVFIDGNKLGVTPLAFVLIKRENLRTITIKLAGYKPVERQYNPDGKVIPIGLTLEKDKPATDVK
jgi:hypothetical protein